MINNDVIRNIRFVLSINNTKLIEICKLGDQNVSEDEISSYIKKEDEVGFTECPANTLIAFLNGLIYFKRGKDNDRPMLQSERLTNNLVLKKLRVAFQLKDDDILKMYESVDKKISKAELSAFFRKEDHPNYRECKDQFLRNFLKGLAVKIKKIS